MRSLDTNIPTLFIISTQLIPDRYNGEKDVLHRYQHWIKTNGTVSSV